MELLEQMLEIETQAREMIEQAQNEANAIRKKARDDAQQVIVDGRKMMHERLQQDITELEREAQVRKDAILQEADRQLQTMRQQAAERMEYAVEQVMQMLLNTSEQVTME